MADTGTDIARSDAGGIIRAPVSSSPWVNEATLFAFDDIVFPAVHNLRLRMVSPEKFRNNPVVKRGRKGSPDEFGVQFYGSILRHDGIYKLWYVAADERINSDNHIAAGSGWKQAYAESEDGIHWVKPNLGLVEYNGSRNNNLVLVEPARLATVNIKVLFDPDDPDPSRHFKMTTHTWWLENGERGRGTLCPLLSPDGLRWRVATDAVPVSGCMPMDKTVLPHHHFEAGSGFYKWNGMYYITGQSSLPSDLCARDYSGREVGIHRSADFLHWSETSTVGFVREGQYHRRENAGPFRYGEGEEAHEGVCVWNRGNVLIGLYGIWHGAPKWMGRTIDLGLLISNDGLHFREPLTEYVFLERGGDGAWDQGGLIQGQGFENVGDQTFIWYGAWDPRVFNPYVPRGGVGLAVLERDRFGYLSVRDPGRRGVLVSESIRVDARFMLYCNARGLSAEAMLRFEMLDEYEQPLPGFSGNDAAVVAESGLRVPLVWKSGTRIDLDRKLFKIKAAFEGHRCEDAKLYTVYISG